MEIIIDELLLEQKLVTIEDNLQALMEVNDAINDLSSFVSATFHKPTRSNIALARGLIARVEQVTGIQGVVKVTQEPEAFRTMLDFDQEGLREFGGRVYRTIAKFINRFIAFIRGFFKRSSDDTAKVLQKAQGAREVMEEWLEESDKAIRELSLTPGGKLTKADMEKLKEMKRQVAVDRNGKIITAAAYRENVLSIIKLKSLNADGKISKGFSGGTFRSLHPAIRSAIDFGNTVTKLGYNSDIQALVERALAIRTEKEFQNFVDVMEEDNKERTEQAVAMNKEIKRVLGGREPIVGNQRYVIQKKNVEGVVYAKAISAKQPQPKSAFFVDKDILNSDEALGLLDKISEIGNIMGVLESHSSTGNKYLESLATNNADVIKTAKDHVAVMELSKSLEPYRAKVIRVIEQSSSIITSEISVFNAAASALDNVKVAIQYIVRDIGQIPVSEYEYK